MDNYPKYYLRTNENQRILFNIPKNLNQLVAVYAYFLNYINNKHKNEYKSILCGIEQNTIKHADAERLISKYSIKAPDGGVDVFIKLVGSYLCNMNYDKYSDLGNEFEITIYEILKVLS